MYMKRYFIKKGEEETVEDLFKLIKDTNNFKNHIIYVNKSFETP